MNKNKGDTGNIAEFTNLESELTMNNDTPNQNNFQFDSHRELLKKSKHSRLPERKAFKLPDLLDTKAAVCVNCSGRLDADDAIQQSVKVCRKCLVQYAKIDAAIDEASKRKRREMLERFAVEVK